MSTQTERRPGPATPEPSAAGGHGLLIGLLVGSAFTVILNETIMGVALPHLMRDLDVTASVAQWLTTAFMLTMATVIPITGLLLRRFPLRGMFTVAMGSFSVGTLIAALAPGFEVLLVGRVVQAVGTAIMMPLLMTTIMNLVPFERRGQMMGTISIVISVAPAIGPTISGLVLSALDWRFMFWLVLPIALVSLTLGRRWIREVTTPVPTRIDVASVVLSAVGFSGLVYGLSSLGESASGGAIVPAWLPVTVGALSVAALVLRQLRLGDGALLDVRAFATPAFSIAVVLVGVSMMALFGTIILLPLYAQDVLGLSTLTTGLMLLPGGLTMGLLAPMVGRLFDRVGPRPLVIPGIMVVSGALWSMSSFGAGTHPVQVVVTHVVLSIGLGFTFTPLMTTALGSLPSRLYSHGSAIVGTLQQVAAAAGTALFITVMTNRAASAAAEGADGVAAMAEGVHAALLWGGGISALAVVVALFIRRAPQAEAQGAPEVEAQA